MPTYEFRCPNGHEFERFYKTISAGVAELPCPECGAIAARQLSGGAGLVFKGSGFYLTDYGKNAHRGGSPKKADEKADKKAESGEPKAESREPKAESREPKAESREPKAESAKPTAESPKPSSPKPKKE